MARERSGYSPALDGLRGVFILLFIAYHFGLTQLEGMWVTINLFFVLSGFLIVRLLTAEHDRYGDIDVWDFYRRRARRLLPALLVVLTVVGVYGTFFAEEGIRRKIGGDMLATLGYVMNWRLVLQGDQYFGTAGGASPLRHAWTLAIEEQFYLVAPLLLLALLAAFGRRRAATIGVLLVGAVLSAIWTAQLGLHEAADYPRLYYGTDTRAQALFLGAAIGVWRAPVRGARPWQIPRWLLEVGGVVGLVSSVICFAIITPYTEWMFNDGGMLLFGVGSCLLVLACADRQRNLTRSLFAWEPLAFVGRRTYGLYLWHWPIYVALAPEAFGGSVPVTFVVCMVLTVLIAHLSYTYLEKPVIEKGVRGLWPRTRRPALLALTPVVVVAVASSAIAATAPPAPVEQVQQAPAAGPVETLPVLVEGQPEYEPGEPATVGVLGDSVPWYLAERFPAGSFPGVSIDNHAREGCDMLEVPLSFAPGVTQMEQRCVTQREEWAADARAGGDDVLVYFASPLVTLPHVVEGERVWLEDERLQRLVTERFEIVYDEAKEAGVEQVRIVNVPCRVPPADIPEEIRLMLESEPKMLDEYKEPTILNGLVEDWAATHPDVEIVDIHEALCGDGFTESVAGVPLYNDYLHFSPEATPMLWRWILGQVSEGYAARER